MPIDPNIILQSNAASQPVQLINPLDAMTKVMNLRDLANRGQMNQLNLRDLALKNQQAEQDFGDQQAIRSAYKNNTSVDANGNPVLNKQGLLSELGQTSPNQVGAVSGQLRQQDLAAQEAQMKTMQNHVQMRLQGLSGIPSQASGADEGTRQNVYSQHLNDMASQGLDISMYPKQVPDDKGIMSFQAPLLNVKDQLELNQGQQKIDLEKQKANIDSQNLALSLKKNQSEQVQQTLGSLQSARGNPAVQQAEKDVYSAKKVNSLASLYSDPNKLSQAQVDLLHSEVAKMASGGAPTMSELEGIAPNTLVGKSSKVYSEFMNKPTPANAAAFVKQAQSYANSIAKDAKDVMRENYQGIIESKKPYLSPGDYNTLNDQFMSRVNGDNAPGDWSGAGSQAAQAPQAGTNQNPSAGAGQTAAPVKKLYNAGKNITRFVYSDGTQKDVQGRQ